MHEPTYLDLRHAIAAQGRVQLPGSKSISNRLLLLAALAEGTTDMIEVLDADDTRVMITALQALGILIVEQDKGHLRVQGGGCFPVRSAQLFLDNAGTAVRSLTAVMALRGGDYTIHGSARMHERPIGDLVSALRQLGATVTYMGRAGCLPLHIGQAALVPGQTIRLPGNVSSQFLTALLLAAPLYTQISDTPLVIEIVGTLISKPYITMTLDLMARYGVSVVQHQWRRFTVPAGMKYRSPGHIVVEGDASSASYFLALGAIGGGPVRVVGVGQESVQGDMAFIHTLQSMGATIRSGADWVEVRGVRVACGQKLRAFDADFNAMPDAAMTAAALALFADGACRLRNIGSWRVKETDRIQAMQAELTKLGAEVTSGPDWLAVTPPVHPISTEKLTPKPRVSVCTWHDHRIAMSLSLAAFGSNQVRILNPGCVSKTFPHYFEYYAKLVQSI